MRICYKSNKYYKNNLNFRKKKQKNIKIKYSKNYFTKQINNLH